MRLDELLAASAAAGSDTPLLIDRDQEVSYGTVDRSATRCASMLARHGVSPGDRVVVALENGASMVAAYFGVMRAGAVAVPLPPGPRSDRLPSAVVDCRPAAVIIDQATASALGPRGVFDGVSAVFVAGGAVSLPGFLDYDSALAAADSGLEAVDCDTDLAAIVYTSGSTGEPRGVMLSHRNLVSNARAIVSYLGLTSRDRVMCVLPFSYVYGLSLLHTHVTVGGSVVIENRSAFPNVVLNAMAAHRVTGFAGVPSTFALMLHRSNLDRVALPDLRYVTQAGGAMSPAKIDEWLARGPRAPFFVMYGATEAAARLTYLPPAELLAKRGSIGRPIPGVAIRVVTEQGRTAAVGEVGELVANGPNIAAGYWNRPDDTAERFGPDGYRTGDLGYADADGCLFIVGRRHDMIKVGANRVGAREIEDVLHGHPSVSEAAVVGVPHDLLGEVPVAIVALTAAVADAEAALRGFCATHLAAYKVPVRVIVLPELPKLAGSGKIDRAALVVLASPHESAAGPPNGTTA